MTKKLAFVGLGAMGQPMARRLAGVENLSIVLFDTRLDAMASIAQIGRCASSLEDAVDGADIVFSMLPSDREVTAVAEELADVGAPGQVYVDFSTIAPDTMAMISAKLEGSGISTVSATCMKGVAAAEIGELSLFIGGANEVIKDLRPLLSRVATEQRYVGAVGSAKALKIINNLVTSSLGLMLYDALLVAARLGSSPDHAVKDLLCSGADSWALRNHVMKHALTGDVGPGKFSIAYMTKDVELAAKLARDNGRSAFFGGVVLASFRGASAHGHMADYHPVVLDWLELGAASEPIVSMSDSEGDPELLGTLFRGVVALQGLLTFEALYLGNAPQLSPHTAAAHLLEGSAQNPFLKDLIDGHGVAAQLPLDSIYRRVDAACELAHQANVPAMTFEVGRNFALLAIERWGESETLAAVLARVGDET